MPAGDDTITGPLRLGSKADDVELVQALVMAAFGGAARLEVDGEFDIRTHRCVMKFQRARKLWVDGIVGPKTAAALGLKYKTQPPRQPLVPGTEVPSVHMPTAQQIVADALLQPVTDFVKLIDEEIRKSGASETDNKKAIEAMNDIILDGFRSRPKRWAETPLRADSPTMIQMNILDMQVNTLEFVATFLKNHGGRVAALADRVNKLDAHAIGRIVQLMLDGKANANAAAWDIGQVMRRALM
jgi:Putative peptidoglycan binding domain